MVTQALYPQGENQAGVFGPGPIGRKGLVHLTDPTASSAESYACGDPSGGGTGLWTYSPWIWSTSHGSMKQEVAHRHYSFVG